MASMRVQCAMSLSSSTHIGPMGEIREVGEMSETAHTDLVVDCDASASDVPVVESDVADSSGTSSKNDDCFAAASNVSCATAANASASDAMLSCAGERSSS
eukprot:6206185-Pleurochrysis_carterae.AAC.8